MYKLNENVKFTQLKKYGFKPDKDNYLKDYTRQINNCWYDEICIDRQDRCIYRATDVVGYVEIDSDDDEVEEYIQDLINDKLAEKVSD